MGQVTQQVAANAEDSAAAAEELAGQALSMRQEVLKLALVTEGEKGKSGATLIGNNLETNHQ
ncbi:hypothetical protein [Dethiosulfatarculus sandiegensis]|uniref:Uncharacterized protein n=1 Tax=Dethiosulfatarculus sandiegensis TaxID=1429043 RepID=A0A0D2HTU2_9BACT|nr:hypothetical protein [Dethiosulfatarculus sandiegensis]KIX13893.1 hypothetical protein X474_11845 [Dethiosulfatarculus sandiegensis]